MAVQGLADHIFQQRRVALAATEMAARENRIQFLGDQIPICRGLWRPVGGFMRGARHGKGFISRISRSVRYHIRNCHLRCDIQALEMPVSVEHISGSITVIYKRNIRVILQTGSGIHLAESSIVSRELLPY